MPASAIKLQRVLVIGPCGAGKSTLAVELAQKLSLPLFHMDQLNWQPGWVESSKHEIRAKLQEITTTERWLIDGNYGGTLAVRPSNAPTPLSILITPFGFVSPVLFAVSGPIAVAPGPT